MMTTKRLLKTLLLLLAMASSGLGHADMVVIVNVKSPLTSLDKNQIADIFLGKAATFPDGSQALPIEQAEGATVREEFHNAITDKSGSQLKSYWSKMVFSGKGTPPKEAANSTEVVKQVTVNPNAIAYVEKAALTNGVKAVFSQ